MAPDVSTEEAFRLARAMTLKNAAAGLPHGGGKSVIFADPKMPLRDKERLIRAFATAISDLTEYIPGPDMGTDELAMGWIKDETGRAVGLPREMGGIPLDEIGATGFGLVAAITVAAEHIEMPLSGARVVIQGFGSVGKHAARLPRRKGAVLVGASDSRGTVADENGLDVTALIALKEEGQPLRDHPYGRKLGQDAVIDIPCEIWIPAARPDVIHAGNVARLNTRLMAQGANIPCTAEAEEALAPAMCWSCPTSSPMPAGSSAPRSNTSAAPRPRPSPRSMKKSAPTPRPCSTRCDAPAPLPRTAAVSLATERVRRAMRTRRWDGGAE